MPCPPFKICERNYLLVIKIRYNDNEITAVGHSGYAERGKDIVCAGVSSAFKLAIATLVELKAKFRFHFDEDDAFIGIQIKKGNKTTVKAVLTALIEVLTSISEEYPDNVSVAEVTENHQIN